MFWPKMWGIVEFWWTLETTISPNKKDIVQLCIGVKNFNSHPILGEI